MPNLGHGVCKEVFVSESCKDDKQKTTPSDSPTQAEPETDTELGGPVICKNNAEHHPNSSFPHRERTHNGHPVTNKDRSAKEQQGTEASPSHGKNDSNTTMPVQKHNIKVEFSSKADIKAQNAPSAPKRRRTLDQPFMNTNNSTETSVAPSFNAKQLEFFKNAIAQSGHFNTQNIMLT